MVPIKIKIGDRFGRLTVIERAENRGKKLRWVCKCDCGNVGTYDGSNLRAGGTKSCGCLRSEASKKKAIPTHGVDDLESLHPDVCKDWDKIRNLYLERPLPEQYTETSGIKVHWNCHICNETWETTIASRTSINKKTGKPAGCPYCAGIKPIFGKTDLHTLFPDVCKDWDYKRNASLKNPYSYLYRPGSNDSVHWKCHNCGHTWDDTINHRTHGRGCPKCKSHYKTSFPEQAVYYYVKQIFPNAENRNKKRIGAELDVYIPEIDTGIEYDGFYFHRKKSNRESIENNKDRLANLSNLRLIHIKESEEITDIKIDDNAIIFPLDDNRDYLSRVIEGLLKNLLPVDCDIDIWRDSAKIMSLYDYEIKKNSIGTKRPDLLRFWDYEKNGNLNPYAVKLSCNTDVWWICPICGKSYPAPPYSKVRKDFGRAITCQDCYYYRKKEIDAWESAHPFKDERNDNR